MTTYKVILRTLYEFSNPEQNYYEITLEADLPYRMGVANCDLLTIRRSVEVGKLLPVGSILTLNLWSSPVEKKAEHV